ncbi:MAG: enoyl-CoA hydratase/isomerase family protein [Paracoccus sp. (in: a-proteobacteria)]
MSEHISITRDRRAGRITFARPEALNALSHEMSNTIHAALLDWRDNPEIRLIIIDAEGTRAFCAGGDIAAVYHAARAGDHTLGQRFFFDEYRMNAEIANYPKPVIAFMQGYVMGGGVGVGGHASRRIVGDSTRIAMPEAGIGLIPDVGGSWLLARAPRQIGEYLTLTGARIGPGDAIHAGLADLYLPEAEWPALQDRLAETGDIGILRGAEPPLALLADRDLSGFVGDSLGEIMAALEAAGAEDLLEPLRRNSPLSMAAGLILLRLSRNDSQIEQSLAREYRFTHRATRQADFLEGVRAQLIDKDCDPHWSADCSEDAIVSILAPLGDRELHFHGYPSAL